MVYHDFKTPLTAIKASAQLMQRRRVYHPVAADAIVNQVDHLDRLITTLLDTLCLESGQRRFQPEPIDVSAVASQMAEQVQATTERHVIEVVAPAPVVVWWDPVWLTDLFRHLLSNAIQFSPDGGRVVVGVEKRSQVALVSVTDQGVGIPPEALPYVFDRFATVDDAQLYPRQGVGLGLYCARLLLERQGGRLWAQSEPGRGSTFFFTLPFHEPGAADRPPS